MKELLIPKILFVAHDIASGYATLNIYKSIYSDSDANFLFRGPSLALLPTECKRFTLLSESTLLDFDMIITGTSAISSHEFNVVISANKYNIPTLVCVDHWRHYLQRLTRNNHLLQPTQFAVYDSSAFAILSDLYPNTPISIVPDNRLNTYRSHQFDLVKHQSVRENYSVFIDEPISASPVKLAYDELLALNKLIDLKYINPATLIVLLHPSRDAHFKYNISKNHDDIIYKSSLSKEQWIELLTFSKEVYGLSSYALYEAAYLNSNVYSVLSSSLLQYYIPPFEALIEPLSLIS